MTDIPSTRPSTRRRWLAAALQPLRIRDRFAILGLGLFCLPLLLVFGPYLEAGREESRQQHAYIQVKRIRQHFTGAPLDVRPLEERDPWGNPYQVRRTDDGSVFVLSTGANGRSPAEGVDEDDIYPGMPVSPFEKYRRLRRRQLAIAFAETGGIFLLLVVVYLSSRKTPE